MFPYQTTVHPRGCGEQQDLENRNTTNVGSSPRVRGTGLRPRSALCGSRFIPAGAGNRRSVQNGPVCLTVHPRGCGEQMSRHVMPWIRFGSSPRVRGTGRRNAVECLRVRFIPAGAGNSSGRARNTPSLTVHPRGCGEQCTSARRAASRSGSSPRVRGTDYEAQVRHPRPRFIPAGAGNRATPTAAVAAAPVHPRGCGEQSGVAGSGMGRSGSSPRVRGTAGAHGRARAFSRFIPAGAGNR